MSQPTNNPIATLSHFLPFHGSNVMVYSYNNELFVPAKAITEIIGIDWYNVRRSVQADDNQKLYGTITLTTPIIDNFKGDIIEKTHKNHLKNTESDDLTPHKTQTIDILCIRFDRVIMFMTKVIFHITQFQPSIYHPLIIFVLSWQDYPPKSYQFLAVLDLHPEPYH